MHRNHFYLWAGRSLFLFTSLASMAQTGAHGPKTENPFASEFRANEQPGLIIVEAENGFVESPGGWILHTGSPSYLEAGSNHFGNTNGETHTHTIQITEPGVYRFQMKSDITGTNTTESNDTWFKIDNAEDVHFFCVQGGALSSTSEFESILDGGESDKSIYYPAGNATGRPDHGNENPGRNGFFKIYRSGGGGFKWHARTIDNNGFPVYAYFENTGNYTVQMSERSEGHKVDRFGLTHIDLIGTGVPEDILNGPATGTGTGTGSSPVISGELKKWHRVSLSLNGPTHSETDTEPNPFLDYKFDVVFSHPASGKSYTVPGYFAADGDAANTGASIGNIWMAHFTPDETGNWNYEVSFRTGDGVAISAGEEGVPTEMDGLTGSFTIGNTDKSGRDFRGKGRLRYVGKHHLQFEETGEFFLKGGADAPENFLAYEDFDNTPNYGNRRKSWEPHASDYSPGDPTWGGTKGTEIIGALNYLAAEGMNAFSFLTMNIEGDDRNVFPYVADDDFLHFDISKIDQWDIVFAHAQSKGLYLHFKTQETENDQLLDGGELGVARKLYYRMLVARFGYHLALNWNLGEEHDLWQELSDPDNNLVKSYASYFKDIDPYDHHIVIHTYPGQQEEVYEPLLGSASELTGASIQTGWNGVYNSTKKWVQESAEAAKPWVVANDEQGSANIGVPPYLGYQAPNGEVYEGQASNGNEVDVDHHDIRKQTLWGNLMAGGAGVEYYFGYQVPQSDLTCQDYRSRDFMWDYTRHALDFFGDFPFQDMEIDDQSNNNKWVLHFEEELYAVYLRNGGNVNLSVGIGDYLVKYYNPRTGEYADEGEVMSGPTLNLVGPIEEEQDWAVLVRSTESTLSADDDKVTELFNVYPNPSKGEIFIQGPQVRYVEIFSTEGRLIKAAAVQDMRVDLGDVPPGLYLMRILSAEGVGVKRLVRQ